MRKSKFKIIIAILLAAVLTFGLAACESPGVNGDPGVGIESINLAQDGETVTITVKLTDGETKNLEFNVSNGAPGANGVSILSVTPVRDGGKTTLTIKLSNEQEVSFDINDGMDGRNGRGIVSINKTGSAAGVDTYTITYTEGDPTTFQVTNGANGKDGRGIEKIELTGSAAGVDTYTIFYDDDTYFTYTVTNGKGSDGKDGLSAFEIYKKYHDYEGDSEEDWINDLASGRLGEYTVTFDSQGGTTAIAPVTKVKYGSKIGAPEDPCRDGGFTFVGWYREREGLSAWDFDLDTVTRDITLYAKYDSVLFFEEISGTNSYMVIGISDDAEGITNLEIPASYNGKPVIGIGEHALSVSFNSGVSALERVTIPASVRTIGYYAFGSTNSLQEVIFEPGSRLVSIENCAFDGCEQLRAISIPSGVKSLGAMAFYCCYNLKTVELPDGLESIGDRAFSDCHALDGITIPSSITALEWGTFYNCYGLTEITIPGSIKSIAEGCFNGCKSLSTIIIPSSVESIGDDCFLGCDDLTTVIVECEQVPVFGSNVFLYSNNLSDIYVPAGSVEAYKAADGWKEYAGLIKPMP